MQTFVQRKIMRKRFREENYGQLYQCYPANEKLERTTEFVELFKIKNGRELTLFYLKIGILLSTDVFEKFVTVS